MGEKVKIYISGPITGKKNLNREAFAQAAAAVRAAGHEAVNPHDLTAHLGDDAPWVEYMKVDIAALVACDAILLLDGWESSKGARLENKIARKLKIARVTVTWAGMPSRWCVLPQVEPSDGWSIETTKAEPYGTKDGKIVATPLVLRTQSG
jgi:hypothetical protein